MVSSSTSSNGDLDKENLTQKKLKLSLTNKEIEEKRGEGNCQQSICDKAFPDMQETAKEQLLL